MPTCHLCNGPATSTCLRCGRPLCTSHTPGADQRCSDCEADYFSSHELYDPVDAVAPDHLMPRWTSLDYWLYKIFRRGFKDHGRAHFLSERLPRRS